jgi:hypothetical protein
MIEHDDQLILDEVEPRRERNEDDRDCYQTLMKSIVHLVLLK